ncbi:hypothetical protein [Winogradskyella sp.]|uniref:hypothetical protein n=1 Tax=Winogradskyella sp. TaxID=1883156 RepID=UPI003BAAAF54
MKRIILLILIYSFNGYAQESKIVSFKVDGEIYKVPMGKAIDVKDGEIDFSVKRINESAKARYEFMIKILDFLDDFTKRYIEDLDSYLILGSKSFGNDKTHFYHFFKKGDDNQGISILVQCPYDSNEKNKEEIYRVVKSAHF